MNIRDLVIDRPLVIFDTETTGADASNDRIVELALIILKPDGTDVEWQSYVNPGVPIPREATYGNGGSYPGHGISDAMVTGCAVCSKRDGRVTSEFEHANEDHPFEGWPSFRKLAPNLHRGFSRADFAGFNISNFDLPLMQTEFDRVGIQWDYSEARVLDGMRLWQLGAPRSLSDAVREFLGREHEGAHGALSDIRGTRDVLGAQLERFNQLPRDLAALHDQQWPREPDWIDQKGKFLWRDGEVYVNFGKRWKGTKLTLMSRKDLIWIAKEATGLLPDARKIAAEASQGRFPKMER